MAKQTILDLQELFNLARSGLNADGAHHKQWYLEEILRRLTVSPEMFQKMRRADQWEAGIPD